MVLLNYHAKALLPQIWILLSFCFFSRTWSLTFFLSYRLRCFKLTKSKTVYK